MQEPTEFERWFVDCVAICANDESYPDYVWDIYNCDIWRTRFNLGLTPLDAVNIQFKLQ